MTAANRPDWATIPNLVTLVRFVLLAPVCLLLLDGPDTLAVVLLLVWASTDWVDGMLARALDQTSRTGAIIDPIADRVGLVAIVLSLAVADLLPWAALAIILAVDVAMVALATQAALGGRISVSWLGKIRTFVLMSSVFLLVAAAAWVPSLVPAAQVLFWVGVVLQVVSGADYIIRARRAPADAPAAEEPLSPR
ncbi:MAG: CDP-alcohol phosphatidyltransferase family protein [Brachybacterium sp.]|uniref:CDP-alcohol phosphatidyltransferase family protein n=1 Tax=Brachybacterium sp. Z12 TaxID=2759167 RepID=UPI0018615B12|nr:CDP-alcohol phosphatidyltransferase family protein [Brachybacterium sp. Z12]QNN83187.1 CDP-alcohol phosphatidyltransferase family protein [Brachybacterium sp. Z12]